MSRSRTTSSTRSRTEAGAARRPFALLDGGSRRGARLPAPRPLEQERLTWARSEAERRALERAARAALREDPAGFGPRTEALFDLASQSDLLPIVAPRGALPRDFAARCLAAARRQGARLLAERQALVAAGRIVRGKGASREPSPESVARLARFARDHPGEPAEGLARGEISLPGTVLLVDRRGALRARPTIPGSAIVVGPPLRSGRTRLRATADARGARAAARRFGAALALIDEAWPEAGVEVRARTRLVLPLAERGLVSYSLPSRPGVSFINPRGKTRVDLADDLLHETAHHRLHAIERRGRLVTARAQAEDAPRFWSPWRRAMRPARGIFHAVYTFAYRAELLSRLASPSRAGGGRVGVSRAPVDVHDLSKEARLERRRVAAGLRTLRAASRLGLLTRTGKSLLLMMGAAARPAPRRRARR